MMFDLAAAAKHSLHVLLTSCHNIRFSQVRCIPPVNSSFIRLRDTHSRRHCRFIPAPSTSRPRTQCHSSPLAHEYFHLSQCAHYAGVEAFPRASGDTYIRSASTTCFNLTAPTRLTPASASCVIVAFFLRRVPRLAPPSSSSLRVPQTA
jgi:hypothetical protein